MPGTSSGDPLPSRGPICQSFRFAQSNALSAHPTIAALAHLLCRLLGSAVGAKNLAGELAHRCNGTVKGFVFWHCAAPTVASLRALTRRQPLTRAARARALKTACAHRTASAGQTALRILGGALRPMCKLVDRIARARTLRRVYLSPCRLARRRSAAS